LSLSDYTEAMSVAALQNVEKSFGRRVLFDKLNLNVERGERLGLIGANGSGKTTLFKLLVGEVTAEAGTVAVGDGVKVGYLKQDPTFSEATVIDEAELAFADLHNLAHRMRDLEHAMADETGDQLERTLEKYQNAQHEFDLAGGYVWHHRLEATLLGVGLERNVWEQTIDTLSGGQRSRLALAKLLIAEPDLLLLDEPTNHLDLAAIEWLENYLLDFRGAVVLISHDRFLLDRLTTRIVWLTQAKLKSYPGNYSAFVQQRELAELTQQRQFEEQQADIEKQKEFIRRFGAGQRSKEAKGREKRLDRLLKSDQVIQRVEMQKSVRLKLSTDQRAGDRVLSVKELSKRYGTNELWRDLKFDVKRGERIGMIGPNGSGKTTMLRVLLGEEDADGGDVRWGANLNIGYYDQRLDDFDEDRTVFDQVSEGRPQKAQEIRDVLALMLFRGEDIDKQMGMLSGGERARVRLAQLLLDKPNVLVLDEPTNHLDIWACESLEDALSQYEGTVIVVSHDRTFLNRVAQMLIVFEDGKVHVVYGNYDTYRALAAQQTPVKGKQKEKVEVVSKTEPTAGAAKVKRKRQFPYRKAADLEADIASLEAEIEEMEAQLILPEVYRDGIRVRELMADLEEAKAKLPVVYAHWEEAVELNANE